MRMLCKAVGSTSMSRPGPQSCCIRFDCFGVIWQWSSQFEIESSRTTHNCDQSKSNCKAFVSSKNCCPSRLRLIFICPTVMKGLIRTAYAAPVYVQHFPPPPPPPFCFAWQRGAILQWLILFRSTASALAYEPKTPADQPSPGLLGKPYM